jgi:single-strand DNA-binding protein
MLNKSMIIGRIGQAPKAFAKGCSFSVATDSGWGEKKTTIWENVSVFGKQAEFVLKYAQKGQLVYVSGRREQSTKGDKVYVNIIADEVKLLDKGKGETQASPADDSDIPL